MQAVTHDGVFHADDVFAAATLTAAVSGVTILRTRNPAIVAGADLAFDVGEGRYDHHQRGGNGARPNGIPYASFGLVWQDYGALAVATILQCGGALAALVAAEVDRLLVQPVDAADNGVALHTGEPSFEGVRGLNVSGLIAWHNPSFGQPDDSAEVDRAFWRAVSFAASVLELAVRQAASIIQAAEHLENSVARQQGGVVVFDHYVPDWQRGVCASDALLVVYPSGGTWRVQTVPAVYGQPGSRKLLPEAWAGLSDAALAAVTGVEDATFAHRGRFIAGARSREGALALARLALGR